MEQDGFLWIRKEELLHGGGKILCRIAINVLNAKGIGQDCIFGILFISYRQITFIVEQTLPVFNHHLCLIVQNHNFHRYFSFCHSFQFGKGHVEGSITVDGNANFASIGKFGANDISKRDTHGTQGSTGQHLSWFGPCNKLRGHHLVDTDPCGKDGIIHLVCPQELVIHFLHHELCGHGSAIMCDGRVFGIRYLLRFKLRNENGVFLLKRFHVIHPFHCFSSIRKSVILGDGGIHRL
mmetsp:Transcript_20930/g.23453  ORF Transcript_20930/g.23453 Transcript_20930/m.23453 type:complete len:237 (-) Transcript_20930:104-814(-)